jgi:hypothetical protein
MIDQMKNPKIKTQKTKKNPANPANESIIPQRNKPTTFAKF